MGWPSPHLTGCCPALALVLCCRLGLCCAAASRPFEGPTSPPTHLAHLVCSAQPSDLYAQPEGGGRGGKAGFKAPLTRVVATPCYRWAWARRRRQGRCAA